MAKKVIRVVEYNHKWPKVFEAHANEIKTVLRENAVKIYHVGSTSVPGLCAKPTVDIMCVVKNLKTATETLKSLGYISKGEFNIPLRLFFNKKVPDDINLHVLKENNGEIEWNLCFQNYLRKNKDAKELYAKTKIDLINQNPDGFNILHNSLPEYTIRKGKIISEIAKMAGFNGYRFVIASNENEMESCKRLLNLNEINFESKHNVYLCLYKGVDVTASAMLEFNGRYLEDVNVVSIEKMGFLDKESKTVLLSRMKEWFEFKNIKEVYLDEEKHI